jgi:AcrR family transcriptional regulator
MPAAKTRLPSEQRRAAIVSAAIDLFSKNGFRGATTRKLAEAVGVTEPVLYAHFQTKRDLYHAIIESLIQDRIDETALNATLKAAEAGDDLGFFASLAHLILDWHLNQPDALRLLIYSGLEGHELANLFYERHVVSFFRIVEDYIRRRIDQGAFRPVDPVIAARAFAGMVGQYGKDCVVFPHSTPDIAPESVISSMVSIFLEGIRAR